ncbi:uncharacterized protein DNG_06270 [Cephalotrichum gorgonifer]|uniref:Heterokaryon incompatibility domain-containing protein n=1 Tax=Cephalotrichum gorgonifer TaxID=2041049 RepID=A0AAE8SX38_9PEZI|nr:uncharacterized protein DNG_06270 [Cephalotrichum gorgonifer]
MGSHLRGNGTTEPSCVLEIPFRRLSSTPISLSEAQTCQYRFLDCHNFTRGESLRIVQFSQLPVGEYSALSYVWRGLKRQADIAAGSDSFISIKGADGADPISVDVLRLACLLSISLGCGFLWLDGVCIMQSNTDDKDWQIQRMHDIYKFCKECIVIPGGLSRLATLFEETFWIHRAWTLQEAIAPPSAKCLFAWEDGDCVFQSNFPVFVKVVEEGTAAMADMKGLLQMSLKGSFKIVTMDQDWKVQTERDSGADITIFGDSHTQLSQIAALIGAMDLKGEEGMANAIWRSSFTRSARYPVDRVFSIMGLLSVTLDTSKFGPEDDLGATLALMRTMLEDGRRAEWLAIATRMDVNPELSTLPVFPKPSMSGTAVVATEDGDKEVSMLMDSWWSIGKTPVGVLDDAGYFRFEALGVPVCRVDGEEKPGSVFGSARGGIWKVSPDHTGSIYAVFIGKKERYRSGIASWMTDPQDSTLMLIEEHAPEKFHVVEYAFVSQDIMQATGWAKRLFEVGGTGPRG